MTGEEEEGSRRGLGEGKGRMRRSGEGLERACNSVGHGRRRAQFAAATLDVAFVHEQDRQTFGERHSHLSGEVVATDSNESWRAGSVDRSRRMGGRWRGSIQENGG